MTELKTNWKLFLEEINYLEKEGLSLFDTSPRGSDEEEKFAADLNIWRTNVITFFDKSFDVNNIYSREFKHLHSNNFRIPGQQSPQKIRLSELKQRLGIDIQYLKYNKNILKVSDSITKPAECNLSQRGNYTTEDTLELILEKLYELYDDNTYPILPILEGNGVKLKRKREEFEYVELLEANGYVQSNNLGHQADAQLTVNGKLYIEEKRKRIEPNYNSISDDSDIINAKLDELTKKLNELGFGQEIIFNEIDELRKLYPTLNKKNWGQLVKGKIVDLGLSQVINADVMKMIYEHITDDILKIP